MKISTWNINGLRSFPSGMKPVLFELGVDVLCVQETKINRDSLTGDLANIDGYNSYFAFPTNTKKGYSGVATFCSDFCKPVDAFDHLSIKDQSGALGDVEVDNEGRCVITVFSLCKKSNTGTWNVSDESEVIGERKLVLINVYCPRSDADSFDRFEFKMRFHYLLEERAELFRSEGFLVMIVGDFNISHKRIDHCEGDSTEDFDDQPHRLWMSKMIDHLGYVDCFRAFHANEPYCYTVWNTQTGARATNYGTRVDYILVDQKSFELGIIRNCWHATSFQGSDHCPVIAELSEDWSIDSAMKVPSLCCKLMPEFRGTQKSIRSFLVSHSSIREEKTSQNTKKRKMQKHLTHYFTKKDNSENAKSSQSVEVITDERLSIDDYAVLCFASSSTTSVQENLVKSTSFPAKDVGSSETASSKENAFSVINARKTVPLCHHGEKAVERVVKKIGPNLNKRFYSCGRPPGFQGDKNARCNFFKWI
ncbi:hypothetical protein AB6A40_003076 [Gnathostoma spinigerum]|uniref:DNA-(apurinic or apyrimidinic site) endonuclease n=1 Tax=Gnathostoma spinigerum TaxID=75299 RepID=A0ABD6EI61_9BILA